MASEDALLMHSAYFVRRRNIDAGHGCSCDDVYVVENDLHYLCEGLS